MECEQLGCNRTTLHQGVQAAGPTRDSGFTLAPSPTAWLPWANHRGKKVLAVTFQGSEVTGGGVFVKVLNPQGAQASSLEFCQS